MEQKPRWLNILDTLTAILFVVSVFLVFFYAPMERTMGAVQKVFYFHVATAWVGMLGFLVAAVVGVFYLIKGERKYDIMGLAAIEISLIFFFIAIIMGSIWARPIWNTWWTWDPRLTTATIVELIYAAYMMLRQGIDDPDRRARFGAVYAVLGFVSVPLTFISIRMLRTIHPVVVGNSDPGAEGSFSMTGPMKTAFFFSLFTFSVLFVDLFWHRVRMGKLAAKVEELRLKITA
ncbi:MAG: cytochrome c biogenesis protein CcsA [Anaerolineae bacterium]|nr:cytochrome c biogenesis protein CcsA [Anaerolineae bacterium]MBL6965039.1 cytochrome c biogenesis protein CcsA [Anaerolineales bacterium]